MALSFSLSIAAAVTKLTCLNLWVERKIQDMVDLVEVAVALLDEAMVVVLLDVAVVVLLVLLDVKLVDCKVIRDSSGHAEREAECHTNAARRISVIPTSEVTSTPNSITNRPPA